jgi:hypothetical protein
VDSSLASVLGSRLWQAGALRRNRAESVGPRSVPTGFEALNRCLPGGGWPLGSLTEILADGAGVGELELVMPALASLTRDAQWVAWIAPPYIPYAPALESHGVELSRVLCVGCGKPRGPSLDYLWAAEQLLRLPACGAALLWLDGYPQQDRALRRLQVAAEAGGSLGVVFRSVAAARQPSAAALRIVLRASSAQGQGTQVKILKCRGRAPLEAVMAL